MQRLVGLIFGGIALLCYIQGTSALSCTPCDRSKCPALNISSCKNGVCKDACGCCDKCCQCEGENCWSSGECAKGLQCMGGKCSKSRCPYPMNCRPGPCPLLRCTYGSGQARCQCCASCRREAGQPCGDRDGLCRKELYCKFGKDKSKGVCCAKNGDSTDCPTPEFCLTVRCPSPEICRYGTSVPKCSCCEKCKAAPGAKCGPRIADCAEGLQCTDGICKRRCNKPVDCSTVRCGFPICEYGVGYAKCSCCASCIRGEGERCATAGAKCITGLSCINGKCEKDRDPKECPTAAYCSTVLCPVLEKCTYGSSVPKCSCCPKCRMAPGAKCGPRIADCAEGLQCENGICIRKPCKKPIDCTRVLCALPRCKHAAGYAPCSCCPSCIRGEGERCATIEAKCVTGLSCVNGICAKDRDACPYPLICPAVICPKLKCRHGSGKARCQCCASCLREAGQPCGDRDGLCRKGLQCKYGKDKSKGVCCTKYGEIECPNRPDCRLAKCGRLQKCPYGSSKPKCSCCSKCKVGPDAICGNSVADCATGLKCKGSICHLIGCKKPKNCKGVHCFYFPTNCKHGAGHGKCSCCSNSCVPEEGEICVINGVPCVNGLKCINGKCGKKSAPCVTKKDCTKVKCIQQYCQYGSHVLKGGCCPICLKGPGGKCGSGIADCAEGLQCTDGICRRRCNKQMDCSRVKCGFPTCKHGVGYAQCSCCPSCIRGEEERCATKGAKCVTGLSCVNGKCEKDRQPCPYTLICPKRPCLLPTCKYGIGQAPCQCCPGCKKDGGEVCGLEDGLCRLGYSCKSDGYSKTTVCVKDGEPTPSPAPYKKCCSNLNCNGVKCKEPQNCKYGYGAAPCKCCLYCFKGPNDSCGELDIPCGKGLSCVLTSRSEPRWRCISNRPSYCPNCSLVDCALLDPKSCPSGWEMDPCGCCPRCLKGVDEKCGGEYEKYGRCGQAFVCSEQTPKDGGVCVCGEDYRHKDEL